MGSKRVKMGQQSVIKTGKMQDVPLDGDFYQSWDKHLVSLKNVLRFLKHAWIGRGIWLHKQKKQRKICTCNVSKHGLMEDATLLCWSRKMVQMCAISWLYSTL